MTYFSECFENGTKSKGNMILGHNPSWQNVKNASMCQVKYCQEYDNCKYFVYNEKRRSCNLKTEEAFGVKIPAEGFTFGPKYCASKLPLRQIVQISLLDLVNILLFIIRTMKQLLYISLNS